MMKNVILTLIITAFFSLKARVHAQEPHVISVDVSTLSTNQQFKGDFKKNFTVIFSNPVSGSKITVLDTKTMTDIVVSSVLKDGVQQVDFKANNNNLSVSKADGTPFQFSPVNGIGMKYNDKVISIKHQDTPEPNKTANAISGTVIGIPLHDAIKAYKYVSSGDDAIYALLGKLKGSDLRTDEVLTLYQDNVFITKLLTQYKNLKSKSINSQSSNTQDFLTRIGQTDVTSLADGIAKFLVNRSKQEVSINFFTHFKDLINKPEYRDAQILFPKTMEALNAIDEQIYQYENYISMLRESFHQDLGQLLEHLPQVIEKGRYSTYFDTHKPIKFSVLLGLFTATGLLNGTHPGQIIADLPENYISSIGDKNVSGAIHTMQVLSASVRSRVPERYWSSTDSIKMLLSREDDQLITARFFLGFLYEKSKGIAYKNFSLQTLLNNLANSTDQNTDNIKQTIAFIEDLSKKCNEVESAIATIKLKKPAEPTIDVYLRVFNSTADVLEHLVNVGDLSFINIRIPDNIKTYLSYSRKAGSLAYNISHKNYGSAVLDTYNLYLFYLEKKNPQNLDNILKNEDLARENPEQANQSALATANFIKKYGNFMSNMVKATNSDEVQQAIEAIALPVGSASIKRKSNFNISINGYVGPYIGIERIKGIDDGSKINTAGLSAPIGIAFSKGLGWRKKSSWSASLFLSVIDLGAPVAFRFKDDKTEQIPTIQLKDIVSPGAFLSVGFPKIPLSANFGYQAGPVLRKLNESVADKAGSNYSRLSLSLVLDIPILNFFTSRNEQPVK